MTMSFQDKVVYNVYEDYFNDKRKDLDVENELIEEGYEREED